MRDAVAVASAEAGAAFGDPRVYLERYVERGRHVEVQLLGDGEHVIHLGDRDCSVQRRYQKLIEEAPAPGLDDGLRERLRAAAVALGERLRYRGAGTVEFLVDADSAASGGEFYFLEVNARIQVEHPVTEAVTGIDIVAEQLAIAEGRPLRLKQADVTFAGHAIEVRLNAEDPARDFRPSPGTVTRACFPRSGQPRTWHGVRVDTHLQAGATVPPYYDSLLAKVIARGDDRDEALARAARRARPVRLSTGSPPTWSCSGRCSPTRSSRPAASTPGTSPRWLAGGPGRPGTDRERPRVRSDEPA